MHYTPMYRHPHPEIKRQRLTVPSGARPSLHGNHLCTRSGLDRNGLPLTGCLAMPTELDLGPHMAQSVTPGRGLSGKGHRDAQNMLEGP